MTNSRVAQPGNDQLLTLIRLAQGDRSLRSYAEASGVSASNLSRILNGKRAKAPSREMLAKLTSEEAQPQNGVTFEELLIAAGYQDKPLSDIIITSDDSNKDSETQILEWLKTSENMDSFSNRILTYYLMMQKLQNGEPTNMREKYRLLETIAPGIIMKYLMNKGISFQVDSLGNRPVSTVFDDLVLNLTDETNPSVWQFEYKTYIDSGLPSRIQTDRILYPLIGKLCMLPPDNQKKYSLVTDIKQFYDELHRYRLNTSLKTNLSVILIDMDKVDVIDEMVVSEYR